MRKSYLLIVLGFLLILSSPVFALDSFSVSVSPNYTVINNAISVNQRFNFTINNTDSAGKNITELNITTPSIFRGVEYSGGTTVNPTLFTPFLFPEAATVQYKNNTPAGFITNSTPEYFWFNISANTLGTFNFTVRIKDTSGIVNETNVSFQVRGITANNLPSSLEFGSSNVSINCSAFSNSSLGNITIRISNLTYFNQTLPGWESVVWNNIVNVTSVTGLRNQTFRNFTLYGNYSDYYKYVFRCEANDSAGFYKTPDISFLVSLRNFYGSVKNSTGYNLSSANVSIYRVEEQQNGPPAETLVGSATTGSDGSFSITNINTTRSCQSLEGVSVLQPGACEPMFRIKLVYPSESNANQVGPQIPQFPRTMIFGFEGPLFCPPQMPPGATCGPPKLNGSTFYMQPAAIINLSAVNSSGDNVNFGYEIIDKSLGYPVESNIRNSVSSKAIVVPTNRNYTVMFVRDPFTFPFANICDAGPGAMNATHCPSPPFSNESIGTLTAGTVRNVVVNFSFNIYNLTGCIDVTGNNSPIYITKLVPKLIPWSGFIPPMKAEVGRFNASDEDNLNYSDPRCLGKLAYYRLEVMGSGSGINYFIEFYGKNASSDEGDPRNAISVAAFQNFTVTDNKNYNITLRPLVGSYATGGDVNTSKITVNLFKNTGNKTACNAADNSNCFALSRPHVEIDVMHSSIYSGESVHYIVEEFSDGSFKIPFLNGSTVKVSIFDQGTSPVKKTLNLAQNVSNITIYPFMPEKILSDGTKKEFNKSSEGLTQNITFYRNSEECNVYNPPTSCALEGGSFTGANFDPMKAMVAGKTNLRLTTPNVTLYFINVDLIASGPPEPDRTEQALSETRNSSNLQMAWRFGSMAPKIYDYVLIGVRDPTINSSWSYNMSIPVLFDENWNASWNISSGGTVANLPSDYAEYNTSDYQAFFSSSGMTCSNTSSTEECFVNATQGMFWIKIPHFSGIQPTVTGLAPATTDGSTGGLTGGSTGGLSVNATRVFLAKGKVNITIPSIASGKMANVSITKYEDVAVRQINISVANSVNNIKIVVTKLAGLPASVTHEIVGKTYHYIEITKENITDTDVNKVFINFAVNKTWLNESKIGKTNITLYRWADNKWNRLATSYLNESSTEALYSAESPGLSYFVIGTIETQVEAPPVCTESWSCTEWSTCVGETQTRSCTDANACGTVVNKPVESRSCTVQEEKVGQAPIPVWLVPVVAVILIAIILVLVFLQKKKMIDLSFLKMKNSQVYSYRPHKKFAIFD